MIRICTVAARRHLVASQHPYSFALVGEEQKDSHFPKSLTQLRLNECGSQASVPEKGKVKSTLQNQSNHDLGLFFFSYLSSPSVYYSKRPFSLKPPWSPEGVRNGTEWVLMGDTENKVRDWRDVKHSVFRAEPNLSTRRKFSHLPDSDPCQQWDGRRTVSFWGFHISGKADGRAHVAYLPSSALRPGLQHRAKVRPGPEMSDQRVKAMECGNKRKDGQALWQYLP